MRTLRIVLFAALAALAASCNGNISTVGNSSEGSSAGGNATAGSSTAGSSTTGSSTAGSSTGGSSTGGSSTGGDTGTAGADGGFCSKTAWTLEQPIQPPWHYAGIDWKGATIDAIDSLPGLCPKPLGAFGACPSGNGMCDETALGDANEVLIVWNVATHVVDQVQLGLGYTGVMETNTYPDHTGAMHAYTLSVGDVIRRDGMPFEIQWADAQARAVQITDIFNAAMATYAAAAGMPFDTSSCMNDTNCTAPNTVQACQCTHTIDPVTMKPTANCDPTKSPTGQCGFANCDSDGNCLINDDGSTTVFGFQPLKVYFKGTAGVAQPALSTPQVAYGLSY